MRVRWSEEAVRDLARLRTFLRKRAPAVVGRASERIRAAVQGLPGLGLSEGEELRRLVVPFGASGYVIQYRVAGEEVVVARVWHGRERRDPEGD